MGKTIQRKREISLIPLALLCLGLMLWPQAKVLADEMEPVKRLKRDGVRCIGSIDDHPCTREQQNRQDDYLAAISPNVRDVYLNAAEKGDAEAMYLLSQIPNEGEQGKRPVPPWLGPGGEQHMLRKPFEYPYRTPWLGRAAEAGHPIAQYLLAKEAYDKRRRIAKFEKDAKRTQYPYLIYVTALIAKTLNPDSPGELPPVPENKDVNILRGWVAELTTKDAYTGKPLTDAHYLALIEAAALAQGNGDIAWRLAYSYAHPEDENDTDLPCNGNWVRNNFPFLPGDPAKALHWARIAAEKGNMAAAEGLCIALDNGNFRYGVKGRDPEAARWCAVAAQAMCSYRGAFYFSQLYAEGVGVRKNKLDQLYWERISKERESWMRSGPINKREYIGGLNHD